jgi:hypothetical protein
MSIIAQSPLEDLYVGESIAIPLGDSSPGFVWDVPPGSILPPGLKLNSEFGVLFGVPTIPGQYSFHIRETSLTDLSRTINHFIVEVKAIRTSDSPTIESLIAKALTLNQRVAGQTIYFTQSLDAQNRKVYALQFIDSGGQVRTLASIAIP